MHLILSFIKFQRLLLEEKLSPQVTDEVSYFFYTSSAPSSPGHLPLKGKAY